MIFKSSRSQMFYKIGILKHLAKFTWKHLRPVTLLIETPAQMSSREFCENLKTSFFKEHLWTTPSGFYRNQVFSIFGNLLSNLLIVMNIMSNGKTIHCETNENALKHLLKLTEKHLYMSVSFKILKFQSPIWIIQ